MLAREDASRVFVCIRLLSRGRRFRNWAFGERRGFMRYLNQCWTKSRIVSPIRMAIGEEAAIALQHDERMTREPFEGFSLMRFDGTRVTV